MLHLFPHTSAETDEPGSTSSSDHFAGSKRQVSSTEFGTTGALSQVLHCCLPDDAHNHPETPGCLRVYGMTNDNSLNQSCLLPSSTGVPACSDHVIISLYEMMSSFESFVDSIHAAMIDLHGEQEVSR